MRGWKSSQHARVARYHTLHGVKESGSISALSRIPLLSDDESSTRADGLRCRVRVEQSDWQLLRRHSASPPTLP